LMSAHNEPGPERIFVTLSPISPLVLRKAHAKENAPALPLRAPKAAIRRCGLHVREAPNILSLVDPGRLNGNANELKQWSALCASLHLSRRALGS